MAWYVVSYDLRKDGRFATVDDYDRVHNALRTAYNYCWALQSVWIVDTDHTPNEVIETLLRMGAIDDNDGIIVLEITGRGAYRRVAEREIANWLDSFLTHD